ncbi:A/G-specific adenine glycosylase [Desulfitobacterium sp. PCE1]|uniref:A/G-specific adenine glycosylase n=1 Tax=Desulfitobacterium sp. PCE1 TaxID=146907 RepID=UPI00035DCA47|nr:A/G-specific adenine glycosylase [Desulfitobacterium sp. PCE1]
MSGINSSKLIQWFNQVKRDLPWRKTKEPYAIWVSEVMLQQTQVITVIPYYLRFMKRFPDLFALAEAEQEEVLELWRGLGYYSRARRLWEGARYVVQMTEGRMPENYDALLTIKGVGEYTAAAIASIAYEERVPVMDGNVKRVLSRILRWEEDVEKARSRRFFLEYLKEVIPGDCPGDFNQGMMELGATVCTPKNPRCEQCPLQEDCESFALGDPQVYPVKKSKEKPTEAFRPTLILLHRGQVLLKKRPTTGLLANLWEFPGEEMMIPSLEKFREGKEWYGLYKNQISDPTYDVIVKELLSRNPSVKGPLVHTFSHRRWQMVWVVLDLDDVIDKSSEVRAGKDSQLKEDGLCWMDVKELDRIALPVAFQKIWTKLQER